MAVLVPPRAAKLTLGRRRGILDEGSPDQRRTG